MSDSYRRAVLLAAATSELGQVLARALAATGAPLALLDTDRQALRTLAAACGPNTVPAPANTGDPRMARVIVRAVAERFGGIGVCILVPSVAHGGTVADGDLGAWEEMFQADLWGPILLARAAVKAMIDQRPRGGHLVVLNPAGRSPLPDDPVYCGLCWGLATFAEAIRRAYIAAAIRVTVIETGAAYPTLNAAGVPPRYDVVANALIDVLMRPARVSINEIVVQPFAERTSD